MEIRSCPRCDGSFPLTRKDKIYCSRKCKSKASAVRTGKRARDNKLRVRPYLKYRKAHCEECGFVAKHECQLDVDHIDGNKANNDPSNFQTLCANCHRLKTWINKDWAKNKGHPN